MYWRHLITFISVDPRRWVFLILLASFLGTFAHAHAQFVRKPTPEELAAQRVAKEQFERRYNAIVADIGSRYVQLGETFHAIPTLDKRFGNSRGLTSEQVIRENTREETVRSSTMVRKIKHVPPPEEVQLAINALPALAPGEYGQIHSMKVLEILGPDELLVSELWLVDAQAIEAVLQAEERRSETTGTARGTTDVQRRYQIRTQLIAIQKKFDDDEGIRLKGIATNDTSIKENQRWDGPAGKGLRIAIVGVEMVQPKPRPGSTSSSRISSRASREKQRLVAYTTDLLFKQPLKPDTFTQMLQTRGYTPESFMKLLDEETRKDARTVYTRVLEKIEVDHKLAQTKQEIDADREKRKKD